MYPIVGKPDQKKHRVNISLVKKNTIDTEYMLLPDKFLLTNALT